MLSAPPVLRMPGNEQVPNEPSPLIPQTYDWATQTPEPSPLNAIRVPLPRVDSQLHSLRTACLPIFDQMLVCISSHADVMQKSTPVLGQDMIQNLCQPFFDHVSECLYAEISGVSMLVNSGVDSQSAEKSQSFDKPRLSLEQHLGFGDDDSTDADDVSAFASLLSSDCEECSMGRAREVSHMKDSSRLSFPPVTSLEDEIQSLQEFEGNLMVCRHWKSKGWCRYASQCKFSHPEHKQGMSVKVTTDMNDSSLLSCRSARKRANRIRPAKAQPKVLGNPYPESRSRFFQKGETSILCC